jgi:hypothetical protein
VFGDPLGDDAALIVLRSLAFVLVTVAVAAIPAPVRAATPDPPEPNRGGMRAAPTMTSLPGA